MHRCIVTAGVLLLISSSSFAVNRSAEFRNNILSQTGIDEEREAKDLAERLHSFHVIFVRGIFSGNGAFLAIRNWMDQNDIEWEMPETFTEGAVEQNTPILLDRVRHSGKPILFVTHSRGGLDVLELLLDHSEFWRARAPKVRGWLAMSAPFLGTIAGEMGEKLPMFGNIWRELLHRKGGNGRACKAFSVTGAAERLKGREGELDEMAHASEFRILTFGSWIPRQTHYNWFKFLRLNRYKNDQPIDYNQLFSLFLIDVPFQKLKSDGFVFHYSHILPPFDYVELEGLDHWDVTSDGPSNQSPDPLRSSPGRSVPLNQTTYFLLLLRMLLGS